MRRLLRRPLTPRQRLKELTGYQVLVGLTTMWSPSLDRGRSSWRSWRDYLTTWRAVRSEYLAKYPRRTPPFAERVRQFERDHGLDALAAADLTTLREYGGDE